MMIADNRPLPPHPLLADNSSMAISPLELNATELANGDKRELS